MPFTTIDLSRVTDARLRKAISDGIALREREATRFETANAKLTSDLTATRNELQTARNDLNVAITDAAAGKRKVADLGKVVADQQTQLTAAKAQIADLLGKVDPTKVSQPKIKVDQLMSGLRTQIESLNANTARNKTSGAMLVEGCEVEIKGGLDISNGIQFTTLAESALGANTVSTLRFALRPAPVVRIADDK